MKKYLLCKLNCYTFAPSKRNEYKLFLFGLVIEGQIVIKKPVELYPPAVRG